ncbi:MAG TPA: hypothetical protein VIM52_11500 [Stellaceae bacterium]
MAQSQKRRWSGALPLLCEAHAVEGARDISEFGDWRAWRMSPEARP